LSATEARIGSIGGAARLVFTKGGAVQVRFGAVDVSRLLEAIAHMEKKRKRPDKEFMAATALIMTKLCSPQRLETRFTLTVPIGANAVNLEPIVPEIEPPDHGWDKA
jgi:hypothetical protein